MVTMKIEAAALAEVMKTAKRVCKKSRYNEIAVINNIDSAEFVITDGVEMYVYRIPAQFDREEGNMCLPVFDVPKLGTSSIEFEGETVTVHNYEQTIRKHIDNNAPLSLDWRKFVDGIRNEALNSSEITVDSKRLANVMKSFNGEPVKIEFGRTMTPFIVSNDDESVIAFVCPMKPRKG